VHYFALSESSQGPLRRCLCLARPALSVSFTRASNTPPPPLGVDTGGCGVMPLLFSVFGVVSRAAMVASARDAHACEGFK
jgi:hypothetical protein